MTNKLLKAIFLVCSAISFQISNAQYLRTDGTNSMTNTLNINVPSSYSSMELRSNIGSFIDFHSSVSSDFDGRIIWNESNSNRFDIYGETNFNNPTNFNNKVGIYTSMPNALLDVHTEANTQAIYNSQSWSTSHPGYGLELLTEWNDHGISQRFVQHFNGFDYTAIGFFKGNVLVGKTSQSNTTYKLDVEGKVRANEIVVNTSGADYVFESDYDLKTLQEVEDFIQENGHLPGVPSAAEMRKEGMAVSELNTKLLEKVEELTLYVIELKKENNQHLGLIKDLQSEIGRLKDR